MQTKHRILLLSGLAAVSFAVPYAHAVTMSRVKLKSSSVSPLLSAPALPCAAPLSAEALVSTQQLAKVVTKPPNFSLNMGEITSSCWSSQDDMICWNGDQLVSFSRTTQQATLIPGTETVVSSKRSVHITSLSPNGRWLVWAGGVDGHSTWDAVSTDGTEHRQWPRAESAGTPAISWMQDNTHWVELSVPETQMAPRQWQYHSDNMRAKVYSLDSPDVQDFPLQLEVPDPGFMPSSSETEFIFTSDGHAWLTQNLSACSNWSGCSLIDTYSREDVYQLLPSPAVWKLRKTYLYPKADQENWMFDSPARSPDDQWIVWRNINTTGKSTWRLMLSRTDGTDMRILYQSDSTSGGAAEWSPDSRQIAFDNGLLGICTINLDQIAIDNCQKTDDQQRQVASIFGQGPFPVFHSSRKSLNHPLVAAQH